MNRIKLTTVLSTALLSSFFMPFFYWNSFEMNGFNFILSDRVPSYKYFLLLIPITTLFHLFGVSSEENYSLSRKLLTWIPLTTLSAIFILIAMNGNQGSQFFDNGNIFSNTGGGFWFALGLSLLLAFVKPKTRTQYHF